jgi:NAD(P)-dependent dehydrogenase (short-subunit alcohol dehydrogenase family)
MRNNEWNAENISDQSGTVAVVTGSSSGLGYETARVLATKNAEVVIAVRNLEKGHAAAEKIKSQYQKANVKVMRLDLADLSSVKHFAEECLSTSDAMRRSYLPYSHVDRRDENICRRSASISISGWALADHRRR